MDGEPVTISIDDRVYDLNVVQRAAFRCTDIASFSFTLAADHQIHVTAKVKSGITIGVTQLRARIHQELLDQQLRHAVAEETKNERDLILAYAFSNTKLLGT